MSVCCVVLVVARNVPGRKSRWEGVSVTGSVVWVLATLALSRIVVGSLRHPLWRGCCRWGGRGSSATCSSVPQSSLKAKNNPQHRGRQGLRERDAARWTLHISSCIDPHRAASPPFALSAAFSGNAPRTTGIGGRMCISVSLRGGGIGLAGVIGGGRAGWRWWRPWRGRPWRRLAAAPRRVLAAVPWVSGCRGRAGPCRAAWAKRARRGEADGRKV